MSLVILGFIGVIFYVYLGYFALLAIMSFFISRPVKKAQVAPSVTLMIAAYNEEQDIRDKIENSLDLIYPKEKLEIIVVSDASSDATDGIVNEFAEDGVRLIRVEGRVGKTQARNIALRSCSSDIVLFSDATTLYQKDVIQKLVRNFNDPQVGMVTGHLLYQDASGGQMGVGQKLFWRYESFIKKAQTKLGTLTGSVGCISAFRRHAYTELPPHIIEDFTEPLEFIRRGYRVVFEEDAICYEKATEGSRQEWAMRVRVIRGGLAGLWHAREILNPLRYPLVSFQLISHKLLRWFVPVFAIALLLATFIAYGNDSSGLAINILLWGQLFFYSIVAVAFALEGSVRLPRFFSLAQYFFILNAASLSAIFKSLTTPLETTWETQREVNLTGKGS